MLILSAAAQIPDSGPALALFAAPLLLRTIVGPYNNTLYSPSRRRGNAGLEERVIRSIIVTHVRLP